MPGYEELEARIIKAGICTVCGACISACPLYYVQLIDGLPVRPRKKAACRECGVCFSACYRTTGERDGDSGIGNFIRVLSAKVSSDQKRAACQDGGVATAVMTYALSEGLIDGALMTGQDGWRPSPSVVKNSSEIVSSAKTKYGTSPLLAKLRPAIIENSLSRIGLVGLPCHIQSAVHLQNQKIEPLGSTMVLTVGLFCAGNLEYHHIEEEVRNLGLSMEEIHKFSVRDGSFNIHSAGEMYHIPLKKVRGWTAGYCPCRDYSNELADISVGSGPSPGCSTVIVRTEKGERIVSGLEKSGILTASPIHDIDFLHGASERKKRLKARRESSRL